MSQNKYTQLYMTRPATDGGLRTFSLTESIEECMQWWLTIQAMGEISTEAKYMYESMVIYYE